MAEKIPGVYKITNTITGDFYIGSSKDIKRRWREHKWPSAWNKQTNSQLYQDMQKYGIDKFVFEVIEEAEPDKLKEAEQQFIETLKPTYNNINANGLDFERYRESQKEYQKTDKYKKAKKEYQKTDKYKEISRKANKKYQNQLCIYNGEILTLHALSNRFKRKGIPRPTLEAKKYLLQ